VSGGRWVASTDEERWDCSGRYETRAQALADALGWETGGRVYTGRVVEVDSASIVDEHALAEDVIERLNMDAQHEHGVATEWPAASPDDVQALADALRDTVLAWFAVRRIAPLSVVDDVEWHDPEVPRG
jgi:hypothetical protein